MKRDFPQKIHDAQSATRGDILLTISPTLLHIPLPIQVYDDPFLPFGKAIINATYDLVCGYIFDLAAYLTIGAAGAVALERTIAYVPEDRLSILHGPFYGPHYAALAGEEAFAVDAVTLVNDCDLQAYNRANLAAFVLDTGLSEDTNAEGVFHVTKSLFTVAAESVQLRQTETTLLRSFLTNEFTDRVRAALMEMRP